VVEQADAEVGADDVGVLADEGGTVVDVELVGKTTAAEGFLEGVMKAPGVLGAVIGGVGNEPAVVVR
jgi:hypothetical protein